MYLSSATFLTGSSTGFVAVSMPGTQTYDKLGV